MFYNLLLKQFLFFQAEDGIRDVAVTGVQTCALPISEEMGLVLIHSAVSPNIRERRDCSAALFDAAGEMIAQAAHIPAHLGAMYESVGAVRPLAPAPLPGDLFILTRPLTGGARPPPTRT